MNPSAAKTSNLKRFAKGSVVVREGDANSRELYVVLQGNAGLYKNFGLAGEAQVQVLGQGKSYGEMTLFLNKEPEFTMVALTDMVILVIARKNLQDFFTSQPDLSFNMIEDICKRLESANAKLKQYQLEHTGPAASGSSKLFPEGHGSYVLEMDTGNRELLYEQKLTCPLCGHSFDNLTVLASRLRLERTDNDLRARYRDIEPMHYEIASCPSCLFSASLDAFPGVSKRWRGDIDQKLGPYKLGLELKTGVYRDTFTVFAGFYLAILCASVVFDDHQLITANLWLKLSRLYSDCGDDAMYRYASGKSLDDYLFAYEHFRISEKQSQQLCYIVGDLYFRQEDTDNARRFFYLAKTNKMGSAVLKRQADLRLDEIREMKKEEQQAKPI